MRKTTRDISIILILSFCIVLPGSGSDDTRDNPVLGDPAPLPNYNYIFVQVANDAGAKYNPFGNNTYNIRFEGENRGLNALHISTDPAVNYGQVTVTDSQSGSFYATDSGGKGYEDEIILLVAVNGTIADDFSLRVTSDGYTWIPNPVSNQPPSLDNVTYQPIALDETFTEADFLYGPQIWKPSGNGFSYPIYSSQDMTDPTHTFLLMFIDLNAGVLRPNTALENRGAVRINYSFHNLASLAAFNVYAYCKNSNNGDDMIAWTNAIGGSGYTVDRTDFLVVTAVTPNMGPNTTTISITNLTGVNFNTTSPPSVMLNGTGFPDIVATDVSTVSPSRITCTFDLTGQPAGARNVVVTNPGGQVGMLEHGFTITAPMPAPTSRIGLFRPSIATWFLDHDNNGWSDYRISWGTNGDRPVTGDWDNDGRDEIGLWRPSTATWYLDYDNNGASDFRISWGSAGDLPVTGDWDNDGYDEIGLWRPSTARWYLDYDNNGLSNYQVTWGASSDIPVTGDWDNDGYDEIGLWRPSSARWYLDYDNNGLSNFQVSWGASTDKPVTGDWDSDGYDEIGLFRPSIARWYLDYDNNGLSNYQVSWGAGSDRPVSGAWI